MLVGAPVYIATVGYLYAVDAVGTVLRALVVQTAAWFAVACSLLPPLGAPAIGLGWVAGAGLSAVFLARRTGRRSGASIGPAVVPPATIAAVAMGGGWLVATAGDRTILRGTLAAAAGEVLLLAGLALVRRGLLRDTRALVAEAVRGAIATRAPRVPEQAADAAVRAPL
jgi:hypothetical protein